MDDSIVNFYFDCLTKTFNLLMSYEIFQTVFFMFVFFIIALFVIKIINNE